MKKELFDAICEFCEYLTDWKEKKQYYIEEVLPTLKDRGRHSAINTDARVIFYKIRDLTNVNEWTDIINIIAKIKENPDEFIQTEIGKVYKILFNILRDKYNFQGFIHTTSFENFISIMKSGYIYSRNYISKNNIQTQNIALDDVIEKTSEIIKDYVRFYWRVQTPTNYVNEGIKPKQALVDNFEAHSPNPVIFIMDDDIALNNNTRFTPKNACKCSSLFEHSLYEHIVKYPFNYDFEKIFHNTPIFEDEDKQAIINARHAELLYLDFVSIDKIKKIIFRSKADYDRAVLELGNNEKFEVNSQQFCKNWLYISDYTIATSDTNINLEIFYNFGKEYMRQGYDLLGFSHIISFFDEQHKKIKDYNINNLIEFPEILLQTFCIPNNQKYKYICYYIDDIECIKVRIND